VSHEKVAVLKVWSLMRSSRWDFGEVIGSSGLWPNQWIAPLME
jgi:hypothetical protein